MTSDQPRRPLHRNRGGTYYREKHTHARAGFIGFLLGRGRLAPEIAKILNDGTTAEAIRSRVEDWGIPRGPYRHAVVPVPLSAARRRKLQTEARRLHCTPEELARRLVIAILDEDRVDHTLAPLPPSPDRLIPHSDKEAIFEAMHRLPMSLYMKATNAWPWVDLYETGDGRIRVVLPPKKSKIGSDEPVVEEA